jgi:hypothetical protein
MKPLVRRTWLACAASLERAISFSSSLLPVCLTSMFVTYTGEAKSTPRQCERDTVPRYGRDSAGSGTDRCTQGCRGRACTRQGRLQLHQTPANAAAELRPTPPGRPAWLAGPDTPDRLPSHATCGSSKTGNQQQPSQPFQEHAPLHLRASFRRVNHHRGGVQTGVHRCSPAGRTPPTGYSQVPPIGVRARARG